MQGARVTAVAIVLIITIVSAWSLTALVVHHSFFSSTSSTLVKEWIPADEGDHFPCSREWWNVDAFIRTAEGDQWSLTSSFEYEQETPACNLFLTLFNFETGARYRLGSYGDPFGTLSHSKGHVDLHYGKSWMQGSYPRYDVYFERKNVTVALRFEAVTPPRYVADSVSGAILPMGLGYYIYGFIPRCIVSGTLTLNNQTTEVIGTGYYEHVWGNWTYGNILQDTSNLPTVFSSYYQLARWWLSHRSPSLPLSIGFSSDNNMFGYDWIWASFDNGWSMFYGNIPFWVYAGPAFGVLYLVSDTGEYHVFSDISYEYGELTYVPERDLYYPTAITINARNGDKHLSMLCHMAYDVHTYLDTNLSSPYWQAIYLWESPGPITGQFTTGTQTVFLSGICEIEPERQVSVFGHNRFTLTIDHPSQDIGFTLEVVSHFLDAGIGVNLQVLPRPSIRFRFHS